MKKTTPGGIQLAGSIIYVRKTGTEKGTFIHWYSETVKATGRALVDEKESLTETVTDARLKIYSCLCSSLNSGFSFEWHVGFVSCGTSLTIKKKRCKSVLGDCSLKKQGEFTLKPPDVVCQRGIRDVSHIAQTNGCSRSNRRCEIVQKGVETWLQMVLIIFCCDVIQKKHKLDVVSSLAGSKPHQQTLSQPWGRSCAWLLQDSWPPPPFMLLLEVLLTFYAATKCFNFYL